MVVNPMIVGNQLTLIPRDELPEGVQGNQLGTPYSHTTVQFMSPLGVPCNQPPYGVLAAIDLETRQLLWEKPIGLAKDSGPTIFGLGMKTFLPISVGTPQIGGTVTTSGGLIFSASAYDNTIRATDVLNGEELWSNPIPHQASSTPMSYLSASGKQTIVATIPVYNETTGPGAGFATLPADQEDPEGGYIIAYRLPD